jgi:hypothetical protein
MGQLMHRRTTTPNALEGGTLYIGIPGGPSLHGQRITIIPRVDSCSGDEFMPDYCRVQESNEANNEYQRAITLP